ncbi:hypothetical protein ACHAXR_009068 [Thalassiosira sp. AJA248-18]
MPSQIEDGTSAHENGDEASHSSDSDAQNSDDPDSAAADTDNDENGVDSAVGDETMDIATASSSDELHNERPADHNGALQDEYSASDHSSPPESPSSPSIKLGGINGSNAPAYALLVGMLDSDDSNEVISIPITRLPVTLGKEHETRDPSFVGLKESSDDTTTSKLSQSMCCIFYRDAHGGKLGLYKKGRKKENADNDEESVADPLDGMIYKPYENNVAEEGEKSGATPLPDEILRPPGMDNKSPLPTTGFFAIECTGRKIMVGGRVIKKGQFAMLKDGIPIKIASHCFYFLMPKSTSSSLKQQPSIKVKVVSTPMKPEKIVSNKTADNKKDRESVGGGSSEKDDTTSSPPPAKKPRKSEEFLASFEDKSDHELLQLLSDKVTNPTWDHEGQRLGSTLATRGCIAAAKSTTIQQIVRDEGGVTQREVIDWMSDSNNIFKDYERMMLAKIEKKSFMMSMGKAIQRAGYTKNEFLSGRAFRWNLPEEIPMGFLSKEGEDEGGESLEANTEKKDKPTLVKSMDGNMPHIKLEQDDGDMELSEDDGAKQSGGEEEENSAAL